MPLVPAGEIVADAYARGRACLALNVIQLEHVGAVITGAERAGSPVVLQVSQNAVAYHGALAPIGSAMLMAARAATVPVSVHLDHAETEELVEEAVELGFGSVMFDASTMDYEENVRATERVTRHCHSRDVWVEAELGEIGGKDGVHSPTARTDPRQARDFVRATGVDALAVAVGSSHAMLAREAVLDFGLISELRATLDVPLVLHGSSGVPDEDLRRAVRSGLTKLNIATQLNKALTSGIRAHLRDAPDVVDPRTYLGTGRAAVADEVARLFDLLGTAG